MQACVAHRGAIGCSGLSRIPEEAMAAHSGLSFLVQAFPAVAFIAATTTSPMALVGFALLAFGLG